MKKILFYLMIIIPFLQVSFAQGYKIGDLWVSQDGDQGVVFYVFPNGLGGWAVALNDASNGCPWGLTTDIPGLTNLDPQWRHQLLADTAGFTNTSIIRNFQNSNQYAAGVVDFENGWYLPSAAQLSLLYSQLPMISPIIVSLGGNDLADDSYWCSTESGEGRAYQVNFGTNTSLPGLLNSANKSSIYHVRAVRSFSYQPDFELSYQWSTGDTTSDITVTPTQTTTYTVTVSTSGGCADTVQQTIVVNGAEPQAFYDEICQGAEYHDNGFNLSVTETSEPGTFTYYNTITTSGCEATDTLYLTIKPSPFSEMEQTSCDSYELNGQTYTQSGVYTVRYSLPNGCDSVVTLQLVIGNTPEVAIVSSDIAICPGDSVTLQASSSPVYMIPAVSVGDILCTDGTIVKPDNFLSSGKTAMGVVYYVDSTGKHGWAVHLHDQAERVRWSNNLNYDVPGVSNINNFQTSDQYPDFSGYVATQSLWAAGDAIAYPAAHCVDFPNGWYLPDIGQLEILYTEMPMLTPSLEIAGGEPFPANSSWFYWAATEAGHENPGFAWHVESNGRIDYSNKTDIYYDFYSDFSGYSRVRSIRDF